MVLSIPIYTIFLNFAFPFDLEKCVILQNNHVLCQPCFYITDLRFDWIFCDWETRFMQDTHPHTYSSTHPKHKDHSLVTDKLAVFSETSALSSVGQQMLLDNGWLSNTATVRGQTHGPIRIYPTSLRCCRNDTGYHVKGLLTHKQYKHLGPFFITVLNRQLCIFLSAYIPRFGVGCVVMCFLKLFSSYWYTLIHTGKRVSKPVECCLLRMMADKSLIYSFFVF